MNLKIFTLAIFLASLSACGKTVYGPDRIVGNAKVWPINPQRTCNLDGTVGASNSTINFQDDFFVKACGSFRDANNPVKAKLMMESGVTLNRMRCGDFFRERAGHQTQQRLVRRAIAPASALITGVLGVVNFETIEGQDEALQILGIAQAATIAGLETYESEFLFGAGNVNSVRKLTMRDLDAHSTGILGKSSPNFYGVSRDLIDNQLSCTPANVLELAQAAIRTGSIETSSRQDGSSANRLEDETTIAALSNIFNIGTLSPDQLGALRWIEGQRVPAAPPSPEALAVIKDRLGDLTDDVFPAGTSTPDSQLLDAIKPKLVALSADKRLRFDIVKGRIQRAIASAATPADAVTLAKDIMFSGATTNGSAVETRVAD